MRRWTNQCWTGLPRWLQGSGSVCSSSPTPGCSGRHLFNIFNFLSFIVFLGSISLTFDFSAPQPRSTGGWKETHWRFPIIYYHISLWAYILCPNCSYIMIYPIVHIFSYILMSLNIVSQLFNGSYVWMYEGPINYRTPIPWLKLFRVSFFRSARTS